MFSASTRPASSPSSHAVLPQSILSLINPVSSMALINRTLVTSYTRSARCLKLPPMSLPFLSFPLCPSSFFHLFSAFNASFYTSGFHASYFCLWIWLVKNSIRRPLKPVCGRILCPVFTPSFFKVNCSVQWCFSMCERSVFSTDYLAMNMIKVTEHLCTFTSAACMSVLVCYCALL